MAADLQFPKRCINSIIRHGRERGFNRGRRFMFAEGVLQMCVLVQMSGSSGACGRAEECLFLIRFWLVWSTLFRFVTSSYCELRTFSHLL